MIARVAVLGISGVGKSTAISSLRERLVLRHLQASALIKAGREETETKPLKVDDLRAKDIDENQIYLVAGFESAAQTGEGMLVLDGHSLIDTPLGFQKIHPDVFKRMGIGSLIFMTERPDIIFTRRELDKSRTRPERTVGYISDYQDAALIAASDIAMSLSINMTVITSNHTSELGRCLAALN